MLNNYLRSFISGIPYPSGIIKNNFCKSFLEVIFYKQLEFLKANENPTTLSVVRDVALLPGVTLNVYNSQPVDQRHSYDVFMIIGTLARSTCKAGIIYNSQKLGAYSISALQAINHENLFNSTVSYIKQDHYAFSARTANVVCEPASILINRVIPDQKQNGIDSKDLFWFAYLFEADKSEWLTKVGIASITRPLVSDFAGQTWKSIKNNGIFKIAGQTPYIIRSQLLENNFPELDFNSKQTAWNQVGIALDSNYSTDTKIYTSLAILTSEFINTLTLDMIQGYYIMVPTRGINMVVEDYYKNNGIVKTAIQIASIVAIIKAAKYFKVVDNSYFYLNQYLPIEKIKIKLAETYNAYEEKLIEAAPVAHKYSTSLILNTYQAYNKTSEISKFLILNYLLDVNLNIFSHNHILSNPTELIHKLYINSKNIFLGSGMALKTPQIGVIAQESSKTKLINNFLEFTKTAPLSLAYHKIYEHYEQKLKESDTASKIINFEQEIIKNNFMNYLFNNKIFKSDQNTWTQVEHCLRNGLSSETKMLSSLFIISHDIVIPTITKFVLVNYSVKKTLEYLDVNALSKSNMLKYTFLGINALLIYNAEKTANIIEENLSILDHYVSEAKSYIFKIFNPACTSECDLSEEIVMSGVNQDEL